MNIIRALFVSLAAALFCTMAFGATYVVPTDEILVRKADMVVIGRALTSYAEESPEHGIETVTVLSIEDVFKGELSRGSEVKVRVIGGVLEKRAKIIPGAPHLADGERALVFLNKLGSGDYAVTDFGLGLFGFATDDTGREVLIRTATEIRGWNLDGTVHHEARRDADRFLGFVRGIAHYLPAKDDYTVEARPLIGDKTRTKNGRLLVGIMTTFTVTQYTLANNETDNGFRWKVFPTAVNWNKGNNETGGAPNGGTDAINAAFASWNGDASSNVNYVLATTNGNTNGIEEAPDGVNNIVFEKDLTFAADFSCTGGGYVGLGGIQLAVSDGTNMVNSETFFRTTEADVSMNAGVGPCIGVSPGISVANFNSAVAHEFGHTLGLRHADQTRTGAFACTTQPTYDCATSAIMTATVTSGLNAALQPWDQRAVAALYPMGAAPAAPTGVVATASSATSVLVTWTAASGAPPRYNVYRTADGINYGASIGFTAGTSFTDTTAAANTAYLYKVRSAAADGSNESVDSNRDLANTVVFTNATLTPGVSVVKAVDLTELRTAVDKVRTLNGIGAGFYTNGTITAGVSTIQKIDIDQLRTNLNTPLNNMTLPLPVYTNPTLTAGSSVVAALDFIELRNATK